MNKTWRIDNREPGGKKSEIQQRGRGATTYYHFKMWIIAAKLKEPEFFQEMTATIQTTGFQLLSDPGSET